MTEHTHTAPTYSCPMPTRECGWCHALAHLEPVLPARTVATDAGLGLIALTSAFACAGCKKLSIVTWVTGTRGDEPGDDDEQVWHPMDIDAREYPADVDPRVAGLATEAHASLSANAPHAASLMARAAIEAAARTKDITDGGAQAKINALRDKHIIRPDVAAAANEVRLLANEVAHDDLEAPVSPADARLAIEIMDEVINDVFLGPAKLQRLLEARRLPPAQ